MIKRYIKIFLKARPIRDLARKYFEEMLIPSYGIFGVKDVLFVGVAPYTWHYRKLFNNQGIRFITLDRRPEAAIWGSPTGHYTCEIQDVHSHAENMTFDLVILMGIIGYGVNDPDSAADMMDAAASVLKPGGRILVACESKFGIDPSQVGLSCKSRLVPVASYGLLESVTLPAFDYGFHYLTPSTNIDE